MKVLQHKLAVRITGAVCYFFLALALFCNAVFFIYVRSVTLIIILSIGIGAAFIVAGLNLILAKIEYDDEKMITRSLKKQRIIYYKDITFFGRKLGSATAKSKIYYWIIKTKDETLQIDVTVSFQSSEFCDFIETLKKANPEIAIKI